MVGLLVVLAGCGGASAQNPLVAQPDVDWPEGKRAAVVLSYDDSLTSHLDTALPQLDAHGFRATFYLSIDRPGYAARLDEWAAAAAEGHELGNHTLFHPCRGLDSFADRDWVTIDTDLDRYTVERMVHELQLTNTLLETVDGRDSRTFAYPCGDTTASGESYVDAIRPLFSAARGYGAPAPDGSLAMHAVPTYGPVGASGAELIAYVEDALETGGLATFTFHGVGADYLAVSGEAHQELLDYLAAHEDEIWVDTFQEVTGHILAERLDSE